MFHHSLQNVALTLVQGFSRVSLTTNWSFPLGEHLDLWNEGEIPIFYYWIRYNICHNMHPVPFLWWLSFWNMGTVNTRWNFPYYTHTNACSHTRLFTHTHMYMFDLFGVRLSCKLAFKDHQRQNISYSWINTLILYYICCDIRKVVCWTSFCIFSPYSQIAIHH